MGKQKELTKTIILSDHITHLVKQFENFLKMSLIHGFLDLIIENRILTSSPLEMKISDQTSVMN